MAFYSQKKRKSWVWIAIDRYTQEVLGFSVGSRGKKAFKELGWKPKISLNDLIKEMLAEDLKPSY